MIRTTLAALVLLTGAAFAQESEPDPIHDEGDPWCDMLEPGVGAVDCALPAGDLILFFDYEPAEDGATLVMSQSTPEGGSRQLSDPIAVTDENNVPALRDVTGDGVEELFIPTHSGMVNVEFFVWQMQDGGFYEPSGLIDGSSVAGMEVTDDGLIITAVRENAAVFIETAQLLDVDGFVHIYELYVDYAAQSCEITDGSGIVARGLSEEDILAQCEAREWE